MKWLIEPQENLFLKESLEKITQDRKKLLWRVLCPTVTNYKTRQGLIIDDWNELGGININNRCFWYTHKHEIV